MKKLAIHLAWHNFSEYYSLQVANAIRGEYETHITYWEDHEDLTGFDVVWNWFPTHFPKAELSKTVQSYFEPHEFGHIHSPGISLAHSYPIYRKLLNKDPNAMLVPFGANTDHFKYKSFPLNKKLIVGWAGQSGNARKQFDRLKRVIGNNKNIEFKPNLVKEANYMGLGEYKDIPDMVDYYNQIHVYVCSSANEGFGLPLLEASACGRPLITFDVGCANELRLSGAGVIIVNSWKQLRWKVVAMSISRARILGQKSLEAVRTQWQWSQLADRWLNVFRRIK